MILMLFRVADNERNKNLTRCNLCKKLNKSKDIALKHFIQVQDGKVIAVLRPHFIPWFKDFIRRNWISVEENKINKMTQTTGCPICCLSALCSDFRYHLQDGIPMLLIWKYTYRVLMYTCTCMPVTCLCTAENKFIEKNQSTKQVIQFYSFFEIKLVQ